MGRSGGPDGRELSAMLALVDDGLHDEPGPPMPWAVLEGIGRLVGHDAITFCELDFRDLTNPVQQDVTGEVRSLDYDRGGPDVTTYFLEHCLFVSFPTLPGRTRRLLLWREAGSAFSEHDRMIMALLRPHLYEVFLDAERRRAGVPYLTDREWEVLGLAGTGLDNADIARELFLSPATVRKHLEHVYDKLGVRNRRAAAALALPHRPR